MIYVGLYFSHGLTSSDADAPETGRIQRLHRATSRLHACSTREEAYEVVIDAAVDVLGFDWCCLAEADGGMFELVAVSEAAPVAVGDRHLETDEGIAGEAYQSGRAIVSQDARSDDTAEPVDEQIRSGLSVPIEDRGVFQCATDERDAFDAVDVEVVELLLSHAAEAFRRIDNEAELRRQNERLDQFASVVTHDLRNPLGVANGRLELYRETGDESHIEVADSALDRMETLIEDLLTLAREGEAARNRRPIAVAEAAEAAWGNAAAPGTLSVDCEAVVKADRGRLVQLFENLFRNAVEHGSTSSRSPADDTGTARGSEQSVTNAPDDAGERGSTSGPVAVTVGGFEDGFYVADDGPGIPEGERDDVFEMGYSTGDEGTGFGLAIVETIAEAHGWTVVAGESAEGGARFEVHTG